jgi:predicted alpha/beta hydrolase family esterase
VLLHSPDGFFNRVICPDGHGLSLTKIARLRCAGVASFGEAFDDDVAGGDHAFKPFVLAADGQRADVECFHLAGCHFEGFVFTDAFDAAGHDFACCGHGALLVLVFPVFRLCHSCHNPGDAPSTLRSGLKVRRCTAGAQIEKQQILGPAPVYVRGIRPLLTGGPIEALESLRMNTRASNVPIRTVQRVLIVHGYESSPDANWFPWLQTALEAEGIAVTVVPLPDPDEPDKAAWENAVNAALGVPDAATVVVAHSLGAVTALRVLATLPEPWELGGLVLVAGFAEPLEALPELDGFLAPDVDVERVAGSIRERTVIRSDTDPFVPQAASDDLARRLGARLQVHPGAGHFMADDGVTRLPVLLDLIRPK